MPWLLSVKIGLTVLTNSIKMFLSDLLISESLKPGVSISVILPVRAILTHEVTALKDLPDSNLDALYFYAPYRSLA